MKLELMIMVGAFVAFSIIALSASVFIWLERWKGRDACDRDLELKSHSEEPNWWWYGLNVVLISVGLGLAYVVHSVNKEHERQKIEEIRRKRQTDEGLDVIINK